MAETEVGVWGCLASLVRVDRDVRDLQRLEHSLQKLAACLVAWLGEKLTALQADLTLAGKADHDVHDSP